MKKYTAIVIILCLTKVVFAQIYIAKTAEISFFSEAPLENIEATNKIAKPILNASTGAIQVKIPIKSFVFKKPLMQEHFNENYMESDKFPDAFFKGTIDQVVDYTKEAEQKVTATGIITMHGVEKKVVLNGMLAVKNTKEIFLQSEFNIHIQDFDIKVPSLYVKNIAENVLVKINATLEPFKK